MGRLRRLIPRYSLRTLSVFLLLVTSGMGLTTCIDLRMYPEGRQYSERVALGMHLHQKGRDAWPPDEASEGASFEAYCRIHRAVVHALELRAFLRDKRATSSRWYRDNRQSIESVLRMAQDGPRRLERRRAGVVAALPEGEKAQVLDMDREIAFRRQAAGLELSGEQQLLAEEYRRPPHRDARPGARCWGGNRSGQLGTGDLADRRAPVKVLAPEDLRAVAASGDHCVALGAGGVVWAWGANGYGQLGDGTAVLSRVVPTKVTGLRNAARVAAGMRHSMALLRNGSIWSWGSNKYGRLGDGTREDRRRPVQVFGRGAGRAIAAGDGHSLAVDAEGHVWAWGKNAFGSLGDGTRADRAMPARVRGLDGAGRVAAGGHSLALLGDGSVWAWGPNRHGQLGAPAARGIVTSPVKTAGLSNVTSIAAGLQHSLALREDGSVWAWGHNEHGQVGDGTRQDRWAPVRVGIPMPVVAISAGSAHSLALAEDGAVWAWGLNSSGQLGDGLARDRLVPISMGRGIRAGALAGGTTHTIVLLRQ